MKTSPRRIAVLTSLIIAITGFVFFVSINFLFNLDMVGGHDNMDHWKIVCEEDQNGRNENDDASKELNKILGDCS